MRRPVLLILCLFVFTFSAFLSHAEEEDHNALTLIDQQDRQIECDAKAKPFDKRGYSCVTGTKSSEKYLPLLVEYNNENGGIEATAPEGITKANVIYEYQTSTNGAMGLCAIFQDELPSSVGPVGNASVGGLLIQNDWQCGYVYQAIPANTDGTVSELGYSIQNWIDSHDLTPGRALFPGDVSKTKAWMRHFRMDQELITDENQFVDLKGIKDLAEDLSPRKAEFAFIADKKLKDYEGDVPVREIDIRSPSRPFSSAFIYDFEAEKYYRWVGVINQYGDVKADEQLAVSNVIIQRVEYVTSNKLMAPVTIGRGNADIFLRGYYIDGYWVRESEDTHTRFYDSEGHLLELAPGNTFISLLTNSTSVVIDNY